MNQWHYSLFIKRFISNLIINEFTGKIISLFLGEKINFKGTTLMTSSLSYTQRIALKLNHYESKEIQFVHQYLDAKLPCIELGASIGIVSCQIAKLSSQKKIFVEANPNLIQTIQSNLDLNNFDNYIVIHSALAYSAEDFISFSLGRNNLVGSLFTKNNTVENVPTVTLKKIIDENKIITEFNLVMDIEGAELELIRNEVDILKKCKRIIAEFHDVTIDNIDYSYHDIIVLYQNLGFRIVNQYYNRVVLERS